MSGCVQKVRIGSPWSRTVGACGKTPGYGPNGDLCKRHAKESAPAELTWFKVCPWVTAISTVKIQSFTDSSVFVGGRRQARTSDHAQYFPTWAEAHAAMTDKAWREVESAKARLVSAEKKAAEVAALREPDVDAP